MKQSLVYALRRHVHKTGIQQTARQDQSPIIVEMVRNKFYEHRIGRVIRRKQIGEVYNKDV